MGTALGKTGGTAAKERRLPEGQKMCKEVTCDGIYRALQLRDSHLPPDHPDVRNKLRVYDHHSIYKGARYACTSDSISVGMLDTQGMYPW